MKLTQNKRNIVTIIPNENRSAVQDNLRTLLALTEHTVHDFIFSLKDQILLVAVDFEGHPELFDYLINKQTTNHAQVVGGRIGRNRAGQLATSEWSGNFGDNWSTETRIRFKLIMNDYIGYFQHLEWRIGQKANELGGD